MRRKKAFPAKAQRRKEKLNQKLSLRLCAFAGTFVTNKSYMDELRFQDFCQYNREAP